MPPKVRTIDQNHRSDSSSGGSVVAAIPVRYASTRLPGKPLKKIAGVPMIERVYRRTLKTRGLAAVVVLTDDERIVDTVRGFGGDVEMTPAHGQRTRSSPFRVTSR